MGMKGITVTVQHVIAVALLLIAVALLFLLGSLNQFEPGERWEVLALATQSVGSSITEAVTLQSSDPNVFPLVRDTQCLWVNVEVNGLHYDEYQVGYMLAGELVKKTGNVYLNYYEVVVDSNSRLSPYTNTCWIK